MDVCAMVARCHRHQYPEDYGLAPVRVTWTAELLEMVVERPECPDSELVIDPGPEEACGQD